MFQNIIFSIMVVIAVGAGIITCIYEVGVFYKIYRKAKYHASLYD